MTAEELYDQIVAFLVERVTRLDVEVTLAEATHDDEAMVMLRRVHAELTAWSVFLDPTRLGIRP